MHAANNLPRIEKKIMKPADIWTTLLLPTRVNASRPAFSLLNRNEKVKFFQWGLKLCLHTSGSTWQESYGDTDEPVPVPNIPENNMPTPLKRTRKTNFRATYN